MNNTMKIKILLSTYTYWEERIDFILSESTIQGTVMKCIEINQ